MAGVKRLSYTRKTYGFKLHENVDKLIDELAAAETGGDRSRLLTLLVCERRGVPVDEILVPDAQDQESLLTGSTNQEVSRNRQSVA
ncbi:hypothetical protein IU501_33200 [Nocardia otitidiscaviarum]|uniref:hypothetical protein n=1 Tax=Nocardia otitidiscaviarum TaxID=1823 RepID=UPI0011DCA187|nr:hypothetical protein [Nocardia otitidiscaviarum]MBF6137830.1 hypothetical protein [Nocardia otitidiscaviarum]MBF6485353.1 hypothetical protein [Nocardia otitidiscaviarum]